MGWRDSIAEAWGIVAQRLTRESRSPAASRIPTSSRTMAGLNITPDNALTVPTVAACCRYLQNTVAGLPWNVMRKSARGAQEQDSHPVNWLIHERPNPEWSSFQFRETLLNHALLWGNGFAEIEFSNDGLGATPVAIWPIEPWRVDCCRSQDDEYDALGDEIIAGSLFYQINNGTAPKTVLSARRMFHLRGFGNTPVGINVAQHAAQTIGWARAAQLFGAAFFGNGANVSTVVINKTKISPDGLALQKQEFDDLTKGLRNSHKAYHLGGDGDVKRIGLNAAETQLIEVHQFLVEEVCRVFGVPPHKVGQLENAHFTNIEHQNRDALVDGVTPWVLRFETEANAKLFGQNRPSLYTKMNMRAVLRGDAAGRAAFYKELMAIGAISPNEVREFEDLNRIGPEGDIHVMQNQNVTLETILEGPQEPAAPVDPGNDNNAPQEDAAAAAARARAESLLEIV